MKKNFGHWFQMVMFRDFAKRKATSLGLSGFVKNNQDGSVNVVAQGEEDVLKQFLHFLSRGPLLSRVDAVTTVWKSAEGNLSGFHIVYHDNE